MINLRGGKGRRLALVAFGGVILVCAGVLLSLVLRRRPPPAAPPAAPPPTWPVAVEEDREEDKWEAPTYVEPARPRRAPGRVVAAEDLNRHGWVVAADFNRDGHVDVAWEQVESIDVMLGRGDGSFSKRRKLKKAVPILSRLAVADLDGDGWLDLVSTDELRYVTWFFGGPGGRFGARNVFDLGRLSKPHLAAIADVDGDGAPDILASAFSKQGLSVLYGDGHGNFPRQRYFDVRYFDVGFAVHYAMTIGDFNEDGYNDVAFTGWNPHESPTEALFVLYGPLGGELVKPRRCFTGPRLNPLVSGDFDGDGHLDVAAGADIAVTLLYGDGDGAFESRTFPYATWGWRLIRERNVTHLSAADVDGDGSTDLLVVGEENVVVLYKGQPRAFKSATYYTGRGTTGSCVVADFDENTRLDVLSVCWTLNKKIWPEPTYEPYILLNPEAPFKDGVAAPRGREEAANIIETESER